MAALCLVASTAVVAVSLEAAAPAGPPEEREPETKRVEVTAMRFNFVPAKIRVAAGTRLEIVLSSRDVEHGFEIVGTETEVRIPQRGRGSVTVEHEATEPGRYAFRCSHKCGAGHANMRGVIVVE